MMLCRWRLIIVWFLLTKHAVGDLAPPSHAGELRVGYICPSSGIVGLSSVGAAASMAISDGQQLGFLTNYNISLHWKSSLCNGGIALGAVADMQTEHQIDFYLGMPCSVSMKTAGYLVNYWNLPMTTYGASSPDVTGAFPTLIRLVNPSDDVFNAFIYIMKYYKWANLAVIIGNDNDNNCDLSSASIITALNNNNITLAQIFTYTVQPNSSLAILWLKKIRDSARIVFLCGTGVYTRPLMLLAQSQNMTDGDYVFVRLNIVPRNNTNQLWTAAGYGLPEDGKDALAKKAMFPLMQIIPDLVLTSATDAFDQSVVDNTLLPPWNLNFTNASSSPFSLFLYDAVMLWMNVTNQVVSKGQNPRNGTAFAQIARQYTGAGKSGALAFNGNGDRVSNLQLLALDTNANSYAPILLVTNSPRGPTGIQVKSLRNWGPTGFIPPPDTPHCGFQGELCQSGSGGVSTAAAVGAIIGCVIIVCLATALIFLYRRKMFKDELEKMTWKIKYEDILLVSAKVALKPSRASLLTEETSASDSLQKSTAGSEASSDSGTIAPLADIGTRCKAGVYRGITVCVKMLKNTAVILTPFDYVELKTMRSFTCDNLNPFLGLCVDPLNPCIITKFCVRGSLQDTIHNSDIKLDSDFKNALMRDLIIGLEYLHKSVLHSHGRLKSTNCVIDSRWVLQLTDWGLWNMRQTDYDSEEAKYRAMLWTAPEHLRTPPPRNGSQSGDIFSLAIIMQEILFRAYPYAAGTELSMVCRERNSMCAVSDLVGRIRNGETPAFRPKLPEDVNVDARLIQLMGSCWDEDAGLRPSISNVKSTFFAITKGKHLNLMDHMLKIMEKYATDLEEVINERTRQLLEEKRKTDILLYKMMPMQIAESLKRGDLIKPELYRKVAVYFSDIVGFTTLASESTPLEVVNFLNDLWTLFDDTIAKYDVYKVETIGDAYMVASGLPVPNEVAYASELAEMALDILSNVLAFQIRHRPKQQLRVRIGLHTGPVVAGVVGHTMPRYCLFGDTVNLASRMESTGEALRIQITQQAFDALKDARPKFRMTKRGDIEVKGKGLLTTYWLLGREGHVGRLPSLDD